VAGKKDSTVREQFVALVEAVGRENGVTVATTDTPVLSVTIANNTISVEYVDRSAATHFDPTAVRTIRASVL